MRKETAMIATAFIMTVGLVGCNHSDTPEELIKVDTSASYPEKKLILQDFMDVEYIPLETNDEFITQGGVMAVGKKCLLVKNWVNDGDIFVFDRATGKGIKKINRKGQGAEEYTFINDIILDEDRNEIFVNSSQSKTIQVYDLQGNYKRTLKHVDGMQYFNVFDFDKDNLICYDISVFEMDGKAKDRPSFHSIVSKLDGSVTQQISIPFEVVKAPMLKEGDGVASTIILSIIPCEKDWLLVETSTDTVYRYSTKDQKLKPFLVKTDNGDSEMFLTMGVITNHYYFIDLIKKKFDFATGRGFPLFGLMYDKQENALFSPVVCNGDYVNERKVSMSSSLIGEGVANYQRLAADRLVEALEKNELKGQLMEIATQLDEESNPVIMLMKYKQ